MTLSPDEQPLTRRELREREKQMSRKERADATRVAEEAETARREANAAEAHQAAPEVPAAPEAQAEVPQADATAVADSSVAESGGAESGVADSAGADSAGADSAADDELDASAVEDTLDNLPVVVEMVTDDVESTDSADATSDDAAAGTSAASDSDSAVPPIPPIPGSDAADAAPSFDSLLSPREVVEDAVVVDSATPTQSSEPATGSLPFAGFAAAPSTTQPVVEKLVFDEPPVVELAQVPDEVPLDDPADGEPITAVTIEPVPNEPILAPLFQPNSERDVAQAAPLGASFDDLISSRPVGSTDSSTTSALVLPAVPNSSDMGTALDETGEVIITGSINLPSSMGSSGAPSAGIESNQLDALLDRSESENVEGDVAPVSASRAVSTTGTAGALVTPPKRGTANLPIILAISAGVLAVGVIGLLLVAFVFKIF